MPVQAQLLAQRAFGRDLGAERWADGQAMHCDLVLLEAVLQGAAFAILGGHKAAVHQRVEPRVVAGGQVSHHRRKGHRRATTLPAGKIITILHSVPEHKAGAGQEQTDISVRNLGV